MYPKTVLAIVLLAAISAALAEASMDVLALNDLAKAVSYNDTASLEHKCNSVILNLRNVIKNGKRQPYETLVSMVIDDLEARPSLILFYGNRNALLALLNDCLAHPEYDVAAELKEAEVDEYTLKVFSKSLYISRRYRQDEICENFVYQAEYIIAETDDLISPKEYMGKVIDYLLSKGHNYDLPYGESDDLIKEMKACL